MRNFDKMTARGIHHSCCIELGDPYAPNADALKVFEETDWEKDCIAIVKFYDGRIETAAFTESTKYVPNPSIPADEFRAAMSSTLYDKPLNGAYIIEKYGEFYYAMPHTIEELQFDERYQHLFAGSVFPQGGAL